MTGFARYPWVRLTTPLDVVPYQDSDGWTLASKFWQLPQVRPLHELREVPALVVLGERGVGKTDALDQEAAALRALGKSPVVVPLGELSQLEAQGQLAQALRATEDASRRYVFLDGLDDAMDTTAPEMGKILRGVLGNLGPEDVEQLRLRISCRSSRWPPMVQQALERVFGPGGVGLVRLAGLTRDDARSAAQLEGVDPEPFLDTLAARGLVAPMGLWPITLRQLIKAAAGRESLPRSAGEAFERACLELCTERNTDRLEGQRGPGPEPRELLALARRTAAALQFCGKSALASEVAPKVLAWHDLVGGDEEPLDVGGKRTTPCSLPAIRRLSESGMLVPAGAADRFTFVHRGFQEYLAAEYLKVHDTAELVRRELVLIGDGPTRQVVSAQRDVAAWLGLSSPDLFEEILSCDPGVLLLADLSELPRATGDRDRERLTTALLTAIADDVPIDADTSRFAQLHHRGFASTVEPFLDPSANPPALYTILKIVEACPAAPLTSALLDIAEAEALPEPVRAKAVTALHPEAAMEASPRLHALSRSAQPDLAAAALRKLWPDHLTLAELLSALPQPHEDRIGGPAWTLHRLLPAMLRPADRPDALTWSAAILSAESSSTELAQVAVNIALRVLAEPRPEERQPDEQIVERLTDLIVALAASRRLHDRPLLPLAELNTALRSDTEFRRAIADRALRTATPGQIANLSFGSTYPLTVFDPELDVEYWARRMPALPPSMQESLVTLFRAARPFEKPMWAEVAELRLHCGKLAEYTEDWYVLPIDSFMRSVYEDELERQRREEAQRESHRYRESELHGLLEGIVAGCGDHRAAWVQVLIHLHRTPSGDQPSGPFRLDHTGAPSFPRAGDPLRELVVRAAQAVVEHAPLITVDRLGRGELSPYRVPELSAVATLRLIGTAVPDVSAERAAGLALALLLLNGEHDDEALRHELLAHYAALAGARWPEILPAALDHLSDISRRNIAYRLPQNPDPELRNALLTWAGAPRRPADAWYSVVRPLVLREDRNAIAAMNAAFHIAPSRLRGGLEIISTQRWLAAAEHHVTASLPGAWPHVIKMAAALPWLAEPLLSRIGARLGMDDQPSGLETVDPSVLGAVYRFLSSSPLAEDEPEDELGTFVGASAALRRLRRRVPLLIARHGTPEALEVLTLLTSEEPENPDLKYQLVGLRRTVADRTWSPVADVRTLLRLTEGPQRLVADQHQLREVVVESLRRLQDRLSAPNGWSTLLWNRNRERDATWWPSWENDFSDLVATFLRYDLADRKVVVNREVELSRPGIAGRRTDIQIEAHDPTGPPDPHPLTVVIECKGCWNRKLMTELAAQLVDKYLTAPNRAGLYLVAYFDDPSRWRSSGREHQPHTFDQLRIDLALAAAEQERAKQVSVRAMVLDCRMPADPSET